ENDADGGDERKFVPSYEHGEERAESCRRQGREDGEGMNQAFVEHPEDDVDGNQRGEDEERLSRKRGLENLCCARKISANTARHPEFARGLFNDLGSFA